MSKTEAHDQEQLLVQGRQKYWTTLNLATSATRESMCCCALGRSPGVFGDDVVLALPYNDRYE